MSPPPRFFSSTPEDYGNKIPLIVKLLVEELDKRDCASVEGIFRLNGSVTHIASLIESLDSGDFASLKAIANIHTISTTLKRYFRGFSEKSPIIPFSMYQKFLSTVQGKEEDDQKISLKDLLSSLPQYRLQTLGYFCWFLHKISLRSDENHMTPSNLSICITPNIVVSPLENDPGQMVNSNLANTAVSYLIEDPLFFFGDSKFDESCFGTEEDLLASMLPPFDLRYVPDMSERFRNRNRRIIQFIPAFMIDNSVPRPSRDPPMPPTTSAFDEFTTVSRASADVDSSLFYTEDLLTQLQSSVGSPDAYSKFTLDIDEILEEDVTNVANTSCDEEMSNSQ